MIYIDACCKNDYDKVIEFLLEHKIPIESMDKPQLLVAVSKISVKLAHKMINEVEFEEEVFIGTKSIACAR